ncbi:N/A [soil metagenome]
MSDTVTRPARPILFAMTHSTAGGLREIWSDIAEGLAARGFAVGRFVFYPPTDAKAEGVDRAAWYHLVEQRPASPIAALRLFVALVRHLRHSRPAAVITAMPATNVLVPLAVTLARVPTRVFISHHSPTGTHNRLLDRLDGWTGGLACVEAAISVSDAVAATLEHKPARYLRKRRTIHNALPERIELLLDAMPRRGELYGRARRIVALGRLTHQKNYPMLVHAMALVPDAQLDIVGGGEDEAALRSLVADLGLEERVRFAGLLGREEALARVASADIFVQVSHYEGHSLALVEAARLALPLIVSDVAVQIEAITARDGTRCGIVVPLGDVAGLARHIEALLSDPRERAAWSGLSRKIADEASHTLMIDRYEKILAATFARG